MFLIFFTAIPIGVRDFPIDMDLVPVIALATLNRGEYRVDMSYFDRDGEQIAWGKIYCQVAAKRYKKKEKAKTENE